MSEERVSIVLITVAAISSTCCVTPEIIAYASIDYVICIVIIGQHSVTLSLK